MADPIVVSFEFRNQRFQDAAKGFNFLARDLEDGWRAAGPVLHRELLGYLTAVAQDLARRHSMPWPMGTTPKTLAARTGAGIASILSGVSVEGDTIESVTGSLSANRYMAVHETGATIRPVRAQYLAIPLPAALNSQGLPLKPSPRDWPNTFVITTRAGNKVIVQRGRTGHLTPLYALRKQVRIPPRLGAVATVQAGLDYFVDRAFAAIVQNMVDHKEAA